MMTNKKCLFLTILVTGLMCILFVMSTNFVSNFIARHQSFLLNVPEGPSKGDICVMCSGSVANGSMRKAGASENEGRLRDVVDYEVVEGSIFFHEISFSNVLNSRQACAVESAARANIEKQVYVLMTSLNVSGVRNDERHYARRLSADYPNVRFLSLHLGSYSLGTPMEEWVRNNSLASSKWVVSHASDALRFLTLWKYGGTYLDLDIVIMRPLVGMKNYAGAEGEEDVGSSIISLDGPSGEGHSLADAFVREFVKDFRGYDWGYNGPGVMTRVLGRVCGGSSGEDGRWSGCPGGFKVHPPSTFYPIHWRKWKAYFNESTSEVTMRRLEGAVAAHVWNKHSSGTVVRVGSRQPYALLAAKYCPMVYRSCGKYF